MNADLPSGLFHHSLSGVVRRARPAEAPVRKWRRCLRKRPMREKEARREAERLRLKCARVAAYKCKDGEHWHVGKRGIDE
jgi:hypothetical protein